jgi:hypothetical protein
MLAPGSIGQYIGIDNGRELFIQVYDLMAVVGPRREIVRQHRSNLYRTHGLVVK